MLAREGQGNNAYLWIYASFNVGGSRSTRGEPVSNWATAIPYHIQPPSITGNELRLHRWEASALSTRLRGHSIRRLTLRSMNFTKDRQFQFLLCTRLVFLYNGAWLLHLNKCCTTGKFSFASLTRQTWQLQIKNLVFEI